MQKTAAKIATSTAITTLLLAGGASVAFAQTYSNTNIPGSAGTVIPAGTTTSGSAEPIVNPSGSAVTTGASSAATPGVPNTGTTGSVTTDTTTTTPGVPNTGAGGDVAANIVMLGIAALIAGGGVAYLVRQRYAAV